MFKKRISWLAIILVCSFMVGVMEPAAFDSASGNASASGNTSSSGDAGLSGDVDPGECDVSKYFDDANTYPDDEVEMSAKMVDVVLGTLTDAKNDLLSDYSSYYSKTITSAVKSTYVLSTMNYNQNSLNAYYKATQNATITGSCSLVAATSMAEYYTRKGYAVTMSNSRYQELFCKMVKYGISTGAYDKTGTTKSKLKNVFTKYYTEYKFDLSGNYDLLSLTGTVESYNNKAKPIVGHFVAPNGEGHGMLIAGYYDITVKYKKTSSSSYATKTVRYYAVNDGWIYSASGDARISYIRSTYLTALTKLV